jgi:hypothetical protein
MIFYHDIRITAEDANGAIVEFAAVYLLDDVLSMSRGMLSSRDAKIPGSVNGPAGEKPDYVLVAQYAGDAKMVLSTIKGDMDVHLDPGATFALAGGGTFTPTTNGALTKVDSDDIEWSGDPGSRGAQWEYIAFTLGRHVPTGPCDIAQQTEGCQYFTFDYDGVTLLALATDTLNPQDGVFYTVIGPDGQAYPMPSGEQILFFDDGQQGSYCMYSSDAEGVPVAGGWNELTIQGVEDEEIPYSITNLDLSRVFIADGDARLEHYGVAFNADPDYRHMTGLRILSFLGCSFQSRPDTSGMPWLEVLVAQACGLSLGPVLIGMTNLKQLDIDGNALSSSEVNRLLVETSTYSTVTDGTFGALQTPAAPPSGAGLTAKADLEGRSPGWTVTVDP